MKALTMSAACLLISAAALFAAEDGIYSWSTEIDEAADEAQRQDQLLFVYFSGSDWCPYCQRLNKEVLETERFSSFMQEHFVPVLIDFPRQREQAESKREANAALARRLGIRGVPTILVMKPESREVIKKLGYDSGGPEYYISTLRSLMN
jgi:thioredoxin-related protein